MAKTATEARDSHRRLLEWYFEAVVYDASFGYVAQFRHPCGHSCAGTGLSPVHAIRDAASRLIAWQSNRSG